MTLGCLSSAVNRSISPAAGAKSLRWVSMRPEVQLPAPSRTARMLNRPAPSRKTLFVEALAVSTEPVPQFGAPPGYWVPVRSSQLAADGEVLAGPVKSSVHSVVQLVWSGGRVVVVVVVVLVVVVTRRPCAPASPTASSRTRWPARSRSSARTGRTR